MHNVEVIARQICLAPGFESVLALGDSLGEATPGLIDQVLSSVAAFEDEHLVTLNRSGDKDGVRIVAGRVVTSQAHSTAWQAFVADGWLAIDAPPEIGGMGLPQFQNAIICPHRKPVA